MIEIENGDIFKDGKIIGSAYKALRYGYHPAIQVQIGNIIKWFEMDEDDLLNRIKEYAAECTRNWKE